MKVAVAADGTMVSGHFGHCEQFVVADIANGRVESTTPVANPGHTPGALPPFVASLGASKIVAGGMGPRAIELFEANGVGCILGISGPISDALEKLAKGELEGGESSCTGSHDHDCDHEEGRI
ncbi:NifB/NifX family molybdenum-iron cluster-binding protein [Sediminispirochaeta smaragdinae]|jgi:predicted Fe-Mo cluster-binding NifX family protein|uniref:Dinitrogenase iron-molybdenum cofactor biosynthesis protein n=1 Tax=Sediminispirochaeta smaragdinae (strain DSM 11293 / JCM 15392 / SEBR 4228) TaxID=573413 RepID=E1RAB5_SEDSS|nr:NifB/NifX family molybdenum-iron cluster-binding protein [Sediminispirochaeta smaragdinae]ADK79406.1 Dinitrogenase iron-molybdenum cofactor biosynthesis protein [Sediminispirochaeta smaragdinae DSM 11293]